MKRTTANQTNDKLRYVFIQRTRCPGCGSTKLLTVRSEQNGDGSMTRRTVCLKCQHKFLVVVEQ